MVYDNCSESARMTLFITSFHEALSESDVESRGYKMGRRKEANMVAVLS